MADGEGQVVENTATEVEDESDADFDAGFASAGEGTSRTVTPSDDVDAVATGEATNDAPASTAAATGEQTPAATPAPTPAPEPKMVTISETELNALRAQASGTSEQLASMGKKFDQVFGKVGNLEQVISKLRTETPAGEVVQVTDEDFKDLEAEYPELAKLQRGALNSVLKRFKGTGGVDPATVEEAVTGRLKATLTNEVQDMVLNTVLPDWRDEVNKPGFAEWMKAQKPEVQALAGSDKVSDAARMLRLYDRHLSAPPPPPPAPPPAPTPAPISARQRQIAAAVPVRGDGSASAPAPVEDDFEAGFRSG